MHLSVKMTQSEIEQAISAYVRSKGFVTAELAASVELTAGRGANGISAEVTFSAEEPEAETKTEAPELKVVTEKEPAPEEEPEPESEPKQKNEPVTDDDEEVNERTSLFG